MEGEVRFQGPLRPQMDQILGLPKPTRGLAVGLPMGTGLGVPQILTGMGLGVPHSPTGTNLGVLQGLTKDWFGDLHRNGPWGPAEPHRDWLWDSP